jgi:hypothetical protein
MTWMPAFAGMTESCFAIAATIVDSDSGDWNVWNLWNGLEQPGYPIANPITPITIALAPINRRPASPSASQRVPIIVPMRILISRAGAT